MNDLLRMDYINRLPQPIYASLWDKSIYPVNDFEVESGLMRIDVCGLLEVKEVLDAFHFIDADGNKHAPDSFYSDYEEAEQAK